MQTPSPAASCPPAIAADALNGVGGLVLTRGPDLDARLRYHTSEIDNGPALPGDRMTVTSGRQDTVAVTEVNRVVNIDRRDRKGHRRVPPTPRQDVSATMPPPIARHRRHSPDRPSGWQPPSGTIAGLISL